MATKTFCDKCGKEFKPFGKWRMQDGPKIPGDFTGPAYLLFEVNMVRVPGMHNIDGRKYDTCPACAEELIMELGRQIARRQTKERKDAANAAQAQGGTSEDE